MRTRRKYEKKEEPKARPLMIWNVPNGLRQRFKLACAKRGVTMRQTVMSLMTEFCNEVF